MTETELRDLLWHEYLVWCSEPPKGDGSDMVVWLDRRWPTTDNFWEWAIFYKKVPAL